MTEKPTKEYPHYVDCTSARSFIGDINEQALFADGFDNDGDSDDFSDLNGDGIPNYVDSDNSGEFELGETVETGVQSVA